MKNTLPVAIYYDKMNKTEYILKLKINDKSNYDTE